MPEPQLDLSSADSLAKSLSEILEREKEDSLVHIGIACAALIIVVTVLLCRNRDLDAQSVGSTSLTLVGAALSKFEANQRKRRLHIGLETRLKEFEDDELRKKYLDLFVKITESESFVK